VYPFLIILSSLLREKISKPEKKREKSRNTGSPRFSPLLDAPYVPGMIIDPLGDAPPDKKPQG
jgi:hypothetical protein